MTPYGIVFKENIHTLQESVRVWQKKFGVLKVNTVLKIGAVIMSMALISALVFLVLKMDGIYISLTAFVGLLVAFSVYFLIRNSFLREITRLNYQNTEKQIVLYDEKMIVTSPYSIGEYFYDEIPFVHEKNGIVTVVTDEASLPISVCVHEVEKGDYRVFARILKEKLGAKYHFEGGMM